MNKEIYIKQLGNGGAFDYLSTNSSFLIESTKKSYFLFDCGYSVYAELRRQDSYLPDQFFQSPDDQIGL